MEEHSLNSSYREKLIEHLFVGELLKLSWLSKQYSLEVSRPEVDNSGYDIVVEAEGVIRHVQLKSAFIGARTARQNIHLALAAKPSGCVVWVYFDPETLDLGPFLFYGDLPGKPLVGLESLRTAKHTKANSDGVKTERPNIKTVNKGCFTSYSTVEELYQALFGFTGKEEL